MFFVLSGYLITELLLRERSATGSVSLRRFFLRRALRIWPLYYASLIVVFAISVLPSSHYRISRAALLGMVFFVVNWTEAVHHPGSLLFHLWSISVEEQFYLFWSPIVKTGGKGLVTVVAALLAITACAWLWIFSAKGWKLWSDTPVQFLFLAAGAAIAVRLRRPMVTRNARARAGFVPVGLCLLLLATEVGGLGVIGIPNVGVVRFILGYFCALGGCVLIFLGMQRLLNPPGWLVYLGKISYGLYVFHVGLLIVAGRLVRLARVPAPSIGYSLAVDLVALLLSIAAAHWSWRFLETPFLRLKNRLAVVESRPL